MSTTERDWRRSAAGAGWLSLLVGVWLVVSPFVLDYGDDDASWNPVLVGFIVVLLALRRITGFRSALPGWLEVGAGVWLAASGFLLAESGDAEVNAWVTGVVVVFLGLSSLAASESRLGPRL